MFNVILIVINYLSWAYIIKHLCVFNKVCSLGSILSCWLPGHVIRSHSKKVLIQMMMWTKLVYDCTKFELNLSVSYSQNRSKIYLMEYLVLIVLNHSLNVDIVNNFINKSKNGMVRCRIQSNNDDYLSLIFF